MFHIIYKITNSIDGKFYIGAHSTTSIGDNYMGSGKYLRRAIKLYGVENFTKEVLFVFDNKESMFSKEKEIVTEDFIASNNTYNLKPGGSGGNPGIVGAFKGRKHTAESKEKIRVSAKNQVFKDETRKKISEKIRKNAAIRGPKISKSLTGRVCSEEHRRNVALANLGTILINNGSISKKIKKDELEYYTSIGWVKGGLPRS